MVVLMALVASEASAQFAMDMTAAEIRKKEGVMAVEDLAIEETGLVPYPGFCTHNGELYVARKAILATEVTVYGLNYRLQRKQGNEIVVEIKNGEKGDPLGQSIIRSMRSAEDSCDDNNYSEDQLFKVRSVNGAKSATELIRAVEGK